MRKRECDSGRRTKHWAHQSLLSLKSCSGIKYILLNMWTLNVVSSQYGEWIESFKQVAVSFRLDSYQLIIAICQQLDANLHRFITLYWWIDFFSRGVGWVAVFSKCQRLLCRDSLMPSEVYTSTLVGARARVAPGSRWPSDLHGDGSLLLPSTLMAVELSGDTGAPTQSHIRVQSVQSSTCCHNDYDRSIEMFFYLFIYLYFILFSLLSSLRTAVPLVFPLIGLGGSQSHRHFSKLHYLVAQSNFHRLRRSHSLPLLGVHTICAWQHPVGSARWCLSLSYSVCSIITGWFTWPRRVFMAHTDWLLLTFHCLLHLKLSLKLNIKNIW